MIITSILLVVVGFTLITFGANWLTNGASAIAKRLHISEFIIGMTIVAVGTSLPELTVSLASAFSGSADMAIGNVVGSNIFNTLFILGICALFSPVVFSRNNIRIDTPICILVSLTMLVMLIGGTLSRIEGIILLLLYIVAMFISFKTNKPEENDEEDNDEKFSWVKSLLMLIGGLVALIYGADTTLNSAVEIARHFNISERIIAITLLAGGTSLPELAASLTAAAKGRGALALGNIIGSNIANILLILGSCSTILPLTMNGITTIDLLVMVGSSILLLLSALLYGQRRITRAEGVIFLAAYIGYIYYLIG
ncbi:MAG: calcium/sodium antiporter [Alistipes sp.]|nr:calcium/sodium antiporter [Alistipes sp.]